MPAQSPNRSSGNGPEQPPQEGAPPRPARPWRTEGLPGAEAPARRPRWGMMATWVVGYLVLFGLLTVQDQLSGPQAVPYTEFKAQVGFTPAVYAERCAAARSKGGPPGVKG